MVKQKEYTQEDLFHIILSKAKLIHSKKTEWAYTIDHAGNLFGCETGDKDFVDVPEDKFTSANIILHNHPHEFKEPSSFSGIDVFNLLYYKPKEIVLCSYGRYFRMSDAGCQKLPRTSDVNWMGDITR